MGHVSIGLEVQRNTDGDTPSHWKNEPRHEKTNVLVSDLVRHKPGCTATEDG